LPLLGRLALSPGGVLQVEDYMFANTAHDEDAGMLEYIDDLFRPRFKGFRFFAKPNRLDRLARNALLQATGYRLDLRQFGHKQPVYGKAPHSQPLDGTLRLC
jgi:hypothetical protein